MNPHGYQNGGTAAALNGKGEDVPLRGRTVNAAAALAVAAPSPGYRDLSGAPPQVFPSLAVAVQPSPAGAEGSSRQRTPTSNGHSPVIAQAVATQSPLPQQGAISPQASVLAQQAPAGSQAARPNGSTPQPAKKAKPAANEGEQPGSPSLYVANDGAILLHQTGPLPAASLPAAAVSVQAAQAALQGAGSLLPQVVKASSSAPPAMVDGAASVRQVVRPDKVLPAPAQPALQGLGLPAPPPPPRALAPTLW
mmetsp:Transcript_1295/g.3167  ORF Transcript_1295/g.3167 Transcript_1295/m.3167 type:complete len:251 (+) Transcript_1295:140-892(+)